MKALVAERLHGPSYDLGRAEGIGEGKRLALAELVVTLKDVGAYRTWLSGHLQDQWLRDKSCSAVLVACYIEETMLNPKAVEA